ncbi:ABC transporter ATP-binding protein [Marispirochaeta aestuarii]|uniref:ABC transporter ATP-binding protein n=1 Tax=Marispirochaeta aestuarii TaxID=1963862 RepID=UPI0029C82698|nr:ABC transporter ATP-binding protein [Marispirochaeta aestuarii]
MAQIGIQGLTKTYSRTKALNNITLEVRDKEFLVLFGPAGAGKTTLLKMVAGLEYPDNGLVWINGEIVNVVPPANRNISMVFENYALYPHKSVYDNIASPLRSKLYREDEAYIKKEVLRVTSLMKIDHLLERLPSQLSNGQRQRVALGRSLVRKPNVFLMDEPLAHLDAKLRHFMRAELKEMQSNFDTTTIYVTHDYLEALSLGDRIAVLNKGQFEQIGTAPEVFFTPKNEFVAKLIGEPEINILDGLVLSEGIDCKISFLDKQHTLSVPADVQEDLRKHHSTHVHLGIRGSDIQYSFKQESDEWIPGTVYTIEPIGNKSILTVAVGKLLLRIIAPNDLECEMDTPIYIHTDPSDVIFFDGETEEFITRHNQAELIQEAL